jgi:hypothetical protein
MTTQPNKPTQAKMPAPAPLSDAARELASKPTEVLEGDLGERKWLLVQARGELAAIPAHMLSGADILNLEDKRSPVHSYRRRHAALTEEIARLETRIADLQAALELQRQWREANEAQRLAQLTPKPARDAAVQRLKAAAKRADTEAHAFTKTLRELHDAADALCPLIGTEHAQRSLSSAALATLIAQNIARLFDRHPDAPGEWGKSQLMRLADQANKRGDLAGAVAELVTDLIEECDRRDAA